MPPHPLNLAVFNERLKLTAAAIDRVSTAFLTIGFLTPLAVLMFRLEQSPILATAANAIVASIWLFVALALHILSRQLLKELRT